MIKQHILVTVDNVIFTVIQDRLEVLLVKRDIEPFKNQWSIPGGFVLETEDCEVAAYRELREKTNVKDVYLEQLYTFSDVKRDSRGRVITVAYMALVTRENIVINAGSYTSEAKFFPVNSLPKLGFDHKKIIEYAIQRLQWKMEYTNVSQYILPNKFTLSELQKVYEIVLNKTFDVRNFRKKIDSLHIIKPTGEKEIGVQYRPAKLYKFINKKIDIVEIL
ncbi:MAG: NUDIX domain-containing protein [candidate division SR1 bacterium]|nr:NUDIX domain-containing protein [candidate division SR1 bacterium]